MTLPQQKHIPIHVFLSAAPADEALRETLEKQLSGMQRAGNIELWHSQKILPGQELERALDEAFNAVSLILLLLSPDFVADETCYSLELPRALARHNSGRAHIIPILLRPLSDHDRHALVGDL